MNRWIIGTGTVSLVLVFVMLGYFPVRLQRESLKPGSVILGLFYIGLVAAAFVAVIVALRVSVYSGLLREAANLTMIMTSMIFATILAASFFSLVFIGLGGEERVMGILERLPGGVTGALAFTMIFVFVLVFLDFVEIAVIVLPLVVPQLLLMGHDPIWLGILIAINLQTSFLMPSFGFSLFYLRGAAPREVATGDIYRGVFPFIILQILGIVSVWMFPSLSTWLPDAMF